jgi:hypothetical protein
MDTALSFITGVSSPHLRDSHICFRGQAVCSRPLPTACTRARNVLVGVRCAATVPSPGTATNGKIQVYPSADNVAVGDTLRVEYYPPEGTFDHVISSGSKKSLYWAGGFADWSGDEKDETLLFPMIPLEGGGYRVSVCVPDYAKSIAFGFTDESGLAWDTNGGNYYRIPVRFQKRYNAKDDMVEEFEAERTKQISMDLKRESASPPVLDVAEERTLHKIRGEATMVAEKKGLGNIHISLARDTFDRYDDGRNGYIPTSKVATALETMGFDLTQSHVDELVARFVKGENASMTEFMLLYAELELADEGLEIV